MDHASLAACPLCAIATPPAVLAEAGWIDDATARRLQTRSPNWQRSDGACPACIQQALLTLLIEKGERVLGRVIQDVWPLDAQAAFGALPTPLRMRADPRFTGRGVTIALVDAGFFPHADLTTPVNRIRGWANTATDPVEVRRFTPTETPAWPGWDARAAHQWHGLMTSAAAAGNGALSHGLYRGMAPQAELVLVQARRPDGRIGSDGIARALEWLLEHREEFGIGIVSVSLGSAVDELHGNRVDHAVARLVEAGVLVVAAAGNDGERSLAPPATAPDAVTVGGLDDRNMFEAGQWAVWHSNYGDSSGDSPKPELVAPSIWVTAPVLPGTTLAMDAAQLFAGRAAGDDEVEPRIAQSRLVTPHYQHVEGTSFAAPIVAGTAACMLEANPHLRPAMLRDLMLRACQPVPGASADRQGAGAIDAGRAVAFALAVAHPDYARLTRSPVVTPDAVHLALFHPRALEVRVTTSWDGWRQPGHPARQVRPGLWHASLPRPSAGQHQYKFTVDGTLWLADPENSARASDGLGGWNSVVRVA